MILNGNEELMVLIDLAHYLFNIYYDILLSYNKACQENKLFSRHSHINSLLPFHAQVIRNFLILFYLKSCLILCITLSAVVVQYLIIGCKKTTNKFELQKRSRKIFQVIYTIQYNLQSTFAFLKFNANKHDIGCECSFSHQYDEIDVIIMMTFILYSGTQ